MFDETHEPLPAWLTTAGREIAVENEAATRQLELQSFGIAFEALLEHVAGGQSLQSFCRAYHLPMSATRYRGWLYSDPTRKEQYRLAQKIGAESVAEEVVRIADGLDMDGNATLDDVPRSTLKVKTRQWWASILDKERFGDTKTVNTTLTTVDEDTVKKMSLIEIKQALMQRAGTTEDGVDIFDVEIDDPLEDKPAQ